MVEEILDLDPTIKVIMITGHDTKDNALEAIGKGAHDFLSKPIDTEELKIIVKRAVYIQELERENLRLRKAISGETELIASCPRMMEILDLLKYKSLFLQNASTNSLLTSKNTKKITTHVVDCF